MRSLGSSRLATSDGWNGVSRTATLETGARSAQLARRSLREVCAVAGATEDITETAALLTSELVTNAVTHGNGSPRLEIEVQSALLRVTVTDTGVGAPGRVVAAPLLAETGRGLVLVDALSARWGTNPVDPRGKSVWFELDRD